MLDATDLAQTLTVPCPRTACRAFLGEQCVSPLGSVLEVPHRERQITAGVLEPATDGERRFLPEQGWAS